MEENARFCIHCMTSFEEKRAVTFPKENRWEIFLLFVATALIIIGSTMVIIALVYDLSDIPSGNGETFMSRTETLSMSHENNGLLHSKEEIFSEKTPSTEVQTVPSVTTESKNTSASEDATENSPPSVSSTDLPEDAMPTLSEGELSFTETDKSASITTDDTQTEDVVTVIGDGFTFSPDTGVLTVTLTGAMPDYPHSGMPWVEYDSFIKKVVLLQGLTSIGNCAFSKCSLLSEVIIPDSVTSIGNAAFADCTALNAIVIPKSVTFIAPYAFEGCTGIRKMEVSPENTVYHSVNNCLIETATKTLISGCRTSIIPADGSVTAIGSYAFWDCATFAKIVLPDGITSIGYGAFNRCLLTEITIPASVTFIDKLAFEGCIYLKTVYNYSSLNITKGATTHGGVAYYAENVYNLQ